MKIPKNEEVERNVIGAALHDQTAITEVAGMVKPKHFSNPKHQQIWKTILDLWNVNNPIDVLTVFEALKKSGGNKIEAVYLSEIQQEVFSAANIKYHAAIVVEKYLLREILRLSHKTLDIAQRENVDPFELADATINGIEILLTETSGIEEEKNFYSLLENVIDRIKEERLASEDEQTAMKAYDFPSFNTATGGLMPGNVVAVSGYFKKGKTTFATALLLDMAINGKIPAGMISLEMEFYELALKILSMRAGIRYDYLRNPSDKNKKGELILKEEHIQKLIAEINRQFPGTKLFISDEVLDETKLRAKIKYWVKKHNLKIIMIDYLSLIESSRKYQRFDLEIANVSRNLKLIAKELKIAIIVLSQENKDGETAESKALARDADFWFSIDHPVDHGKEKIKIDGVDVPIDHSHFLITFKASRHSRNGGQFLCSYFRNGEFKEIDPHYYEYKDEMPA